MIRIRHISLPGMARHLAANHPSKAHELVPEVGVITTDAFLGKLEDALRKERIRLTDAQFRNKWAGLLVYCK